MSGRLRILIAVLVLCTILVPACLPALAQGEGTVVVAEVQGIINPMTSRYLQRVLASAVQERAAAVVLVLDTPGGLESAMREMVEALLDAPLPVVVYVSPSGARATSAGMFITLAGHVAAMAPGTHIGAAHPVPLGAVADEAMDEKMTSDAAALARSIAAVRGRDADWPAQAVRENASLTADEALQAEVIDVVAPTLDELLQAIDGRQVSVAGSSWTLHTAEARQQSMPMRWTERLIHAITHPDIAYLLLTLGTLLLLAELSEPGLGVGGTGAAVCYVLAFFALGSLPLNWAGLALMIASIVILVVSLATDADAIVSVAALVPFVLGSLILYAPFGPSSPSAPDLRVSPWLIAVMSAALCGFVLVVARAVIRATRLPPQSGPEQLIGMPAVALTPMAPDGQVKVGTEKWSAIAIDGEVQAGESVTVVGFSGVRLQVSKARAPTQGE